jgi:hypothetical protein
MRLSVGRSIRCSAQSIGHSQTLYVMLRTWYIFMYFGDYCYVLLMVPILFVLIMSRQTVLYFLCTYVMCIYLSLSFNLSLYVTTYKELFKGSVIAAQVFISNDFLYFAWRCWYFISYDSKVYYLLNELYQLYMYMWELLNMMSTMPAYHLAMLSFCYLAILFPSILSSSYMNPALFFMC